MLWLVGLLILGFLLDFWTLQPLGSWGLGILVILAVVGLWQRRRRRLGKIKV